METSTDTSRQPSRTSDRARLRRNWKRAVRCAPALVAPSRYVAELMELVFAIGGPQMDAQYQRFIDAPEGRRLLDERPVLRQHLADHDTLASLPEESLGRAYLEFASRYRFDAAAFDEVHRIPEMGARLGWDEDIIYVVERGLQLHDLWHVLGGYGPDWAGEGGNLAFTYGQIRSPGIRPLLMILRAFPGGLARRRWRRFLREAEHRGRATPNLLVAAYEDLLALPLDEARATLGIPPASVAHPGGIPYSTFRYGVGKTATEAVEPYGTVSSVASAG